MKFALAAIVATTIALQPAFAASDRAVPPSVAAAIAEVEDSLDARVGLAVLDTASGRLWEQRGNERFPLNSTFKAFACAALLAADDAGRVDIDTRLTITRGHLVSHSPVLERRIDAALSLRQLCEATLAQSDNGAANLVVNHLGGPQAITGFMRSIGDDHFRLDRLEPDMNLSDQTRTIDASTPLAMVASLQEVLLGTTLSESAQATLIGWMENNQVANDLLRASLPPGWTIADRSGAGRTQTRSIIAMVTPPARHPFIVAIYLDGTETNLAGRSAAIARIGNAVMAALAQLE